MNFGNTISKLRSQAGLSQQEVADKLGMARATYAGLEVGRRDPNLGEIRAVAEYYQISVPELLGDDGEGVVNEPVAAYKFKPSVRSTAPREVNPQLNPEKLREVLLYVLDKVGAKPNIGETVLYKLLYFIDFDYYEKHGRSITGLTYVRNHYGPTPAKNFVEVVKGMEDAEELEIVETKFFNNTQKKYLPTKCADLHCLSASELEHINGELARLSDMTAAELTDLSHKDAPWRVAKQGEPINYRFVFYRTDMTAVTEPEDEL